MNKEELAVLRSKGVLVEKRKGYFVIRLKVVGGSCSPKFLRNVAELAEHFGDGSVHLTVRQSMEIQHVSEENVHDALVYIDKLGLSLASSGAYLRTIVACPGHPVCRFSKGDTQTLAQMIDSEFSDY